MFKNYCRLSVVHRRVLDDAVCCKVWERMLRLGTAVESDSCLEGLNHSIRQLSIHIRGASLIFRSSHAECQPNVMQHCSARYRSWPCVKQCVECHCNWCVFVQSRLSVFVLNAFMTYILLNFFNSQVDNCKVYLMKIQKSLSTIMYGDQRFLSHIVRFKLQSFRWTCNWIWIPCVFLIYVSQRTDCMV